METHGQQQRNLTQQPRGSHCSGSGRRRRPGAGCTPQPGRRLLCMSQCPALPQAQTAHLVLPSLACDPARKRSASVFPCSFSLPLSLPASSRNKERPRRGGGGKRTERLVVLCKGRDEEINNLHYSQEGGERKAEPVWTSWIFLAPANPSWSNILSHLIPFAPLSETHCPLTSSALPSLADLPLAASCR